MSTYNKPSKSFWVISVLALLWNLIGVFAYLGQAYMPEALRDQIPENQLTFMNNTPAWVTAAFAIAVFGGFFGSLLLLFRKKFANTLFLLSLLGVIAQLVYNFVIANGMEVFGTTGLIQPIITLVVSIFLLMYSRKGINNGILN